MLDSRCWWEDRAKVIPLVNTSCVPFLDMSVMAFPVPSMVKLTAAPAFNDFTSLYNE